ncbi:MAG: hypothetical protein LM576_01490 [Thermofilum sp.]|nr:hypothetical protein [Thermofilum sp.]
MRAGWTILLAFLALLAFVRVPVLGEWVEPAASYRVGGVTAYSFNPVTLVFVAVNSSGATVVSSSGLCSARTGLEGIEGVYALDGKRFLMKAGGSLYLFNLQDGSRTLLARCNCSVEKVYDGWVLVGAGGRRFLLSLQGSLNVSVPLAAKVLDSWSSVLVFDADYQKVAVLRDGAWRYFGFKLEVDIAYSWEGAGRVFLLLANRTLLALDPELREVRKLGLADLSAPVAFLSVGGEGWLLLRSGAAVSESGRVRSLPAGEVSFAAPVSGGFFLVTASGTLLLARGFDSPLVGPIYAFSKPVVAAVPLAGSAAPELFVVTATPVASGAVELEVVKIGYADYALEASVKQREVYALESFEVAVTTRGRGEGFSGTVELQAGGRTVLAVPFTAAGPEVVVRVPAKEVGLFDVYVDVAPSPYFPSKRVRAGGVSVLARPLSCSLRALQAEVEEGGEVKLLFSASDGITGEDVTGEAVQLAREFVLRHTFPSGSAEELSLQPGRELSVRLRGAGTHLVSLSVPPFGVYGGCSSGAVKVEVKSGLLGALLPAVAGAVALLAGALAVTYLRVKSNVWRALERQVERGASLSELESRFSAVVSRDAVRDAYEFVRLHRALSSALEQLEPKLEPLSSLEALSDARAALEMIKKALDGSRRVFLKGKAADALRKLRLTAGVLEELLARWRSALEAERAKREGEVGKYKEYLARLEQVRAQRGMRHSTYAKLRSDYESKLRSAERTLAALNEALRALERALQGLSGASR